MRNMFLNKKNKDSQSTLKRRNHTIYLGINAFTKVIVIL